MKILNSPLKDLTFEDIIVFCKEKEVEGIQIDYKQDFPQKGLAKHFAAFSNTRGGIIIIGVEEDTKTGVPIKWEGIKNEGKLIDRVHQFASNVDPIPSYDVITTNEVNGKVFLLIRIFEGDRTPYYSQNDSNTWVRTGNISNSIDIASPDELEALFSKRNKAELARFNYLKRADEIYKAALFRAEQQRRKLVANEDKEVKDRIDTGEMQPDPNYQRKYYDKDLGSVSSMCVMTIQPYFPRYALTTPKEIREKIHQIRDFNTKYQLHFPTLNADPIPEGVMNFKWGEITGDIDCDQLYSTGLLYTAEDILRVNQESGRKLVYLSSLGHQLFNLLKAADNFYTMFGYQGELIGKIKLDGMQEIFLEPLSSGSPFSRGFYHGDKQSLLSGYEWELNMDTSTLHNEVEFQQLYVDKLKEVEWDLGFEDTSDDLVKGFLSANHWLVQEAGSSSATS